MVSYSDKLARWAPSSHRNRWLLAACVVLFVILVVLLPLGTRFTPHVRDRAVEAINDRFQSQVELQSLQVSLLPQPAVSGNGLVLRHNGRTDVAPLIQIGSYSANVGLFGLLRTPLHLHTVSLDRMDISIPPGGIRNARCWTRGPYDQAFCASCRLPDFAHQD